MSEQNARFGATFEAEVAKARALGGEHAEKFVEAKETPETGRPFEESAEKTPTEKLWAVVGDEKKTIGHQKTSIENSIRHAGTRRVEFGAGKDFRAATEQHAKKLAEEMKQFEADLAELGFREKVLDVGLQNIAEGKVPDAAFRDQLNEIKKRLVQEAVFSQKAYQEMSEKYKNSPMGTEDPFVKNLLKDFEEKKMKVQDFLKATESLGLL